MDKRLFYKVKFEEMQKKFLAVKPYDSKDILKPNFEMKRNKSPNLSFN